MRFGCQRLALPAAGENQLTKRETAIVQNQLKNAQSLSRPVHALLGTFSSFETESQEEVIINGGRPNRVRGSQDTPTSETLIWLDLFSKFIVRRVNSI